MAHLVKITHYSTEDGNTWYVCQSREESCSLCKRSEPKMGEDWYSQSVFYDISIKIKFDVCMYVRMYVCMVVCLYEGVDGII